MASIRKFKNSKNFYACFTLPDGRRRQVSTGVDDPDTAREIANKFQRESDRARAKRKISVINARKVLKEIALSVGETLFSDDTPRAYAEAYLATGREEVERARKRRAQVVESFIASLGEKADEPFEYLTRADVISWRDAQRARGISPQTVNVVLSYVGQFIREAYRDELIGRDISEGCRIKIEATGGRKAFSLEEFSQLIDATSGEWRTIIMLAGLTGQRRNDVARLTWEQVDFDKNVIRFTRQKNKDALRGEDHCVPMPLVLSEHLRAIRQNVTGYIMPGMAERPETGRESISDVFRNEILPKIGIVQRYGGGRGDGRKVAKFSFHSLRHTCRTLLSEAGVEEEGAMHFVGHDDRDISRSYNHATGPGQRAAAKLNSILGKAVAS